MLQLSCGGRKIQELQKNDKFYISDLEALVIEKKKGGAGIVLIVKLKLTELIEKNLPFSPLVALKANQEWVCQSIESRKQFQQELVKWSLIKPGLVIPLSSILEDENSEWIAAMPAYLGTANDYMRGREQNGYSHIFSLLCQICFSLAELHRNGFVHLDIKPTNILYKINEFETIAKRHAQGSKRKANHDVDLKFSLSDFATANISRASINALYQEWPENEMITENKQFGGTIPYLAPERLSSNYKANAQSDIFSLGITLVELLTGSLPFEHGTMRSVAHQIISGQYFENAIRLLSLNKINKHIANCVLRLIKYDQKDRINPLELLEEYHQALQNICKSFFSNYNLEYQQTQNYVSCVNACKKEDNEEQSYSKLTDLDINLSLYLLLRDAFREGINSGFEDKKVREIKSFLNVSEEKFKKVFNIAALFELERISHEVNALKKTGYSDTTILGILKQKLPKIEKQLLPAKNEDTNLFSYIVSHSVLPKIVLKRPNDIASLLTSVIPFNVYLYLNTLSLYSTAPNTEDLSKTMYYHDWLNSDTYYYMLHFPSVSDDLPKGICEQDAFCRAIDNLKEGKSQLGCYYSIVLHNKKTKQYHCLSVGNSAFGLDVRTSLEWSRITKRYYRHTIPTTDCEMPFEEVHGEAKMSEKECLAPENILKFLKDNVTKIFES